MKLEKGMISSSQLTFLISAFIQGSLFCTALVFSVSYRDIWLVTIVSFILFLVLFFVYINLMQSIPGKNLIEIDDIVFGPYLGKIISTVYIYFFIIMSVANTRYACEFVVGIFMNETPLIAVAVMFILLCTWAVKSGIEVFARLSFVFTTIVSVSVVLIFLLNLNLMDLNNFLPILRLPVLNFVQATHIIFSIFFCETFIFMMVIPYMSDQKKLKKSYMLGLLIGEATLLMICIIITSTMGPAAVNVSNPLIVMVREIDISKAITRIEFLILTIILISVFMKVTVSYYASTLGIAQLLNLRDYKPLVIPIGAVIIALIVPMFYNPIVQTECGQKTWSTFASIFEIVLPVATLITAKIRGISAKVEMQI